MIQKKCVSSETFKTNAISDLDIQQFVRAYLFPTDFESLSYVSPSLWFYKKLDAFYAESFNGEEWLGLMRFFSTRLVSLKNGKKLKEAQACMKTVLRKNSVQEDIEEFAVSEHKLINSFADREHMLLGGADVGKTKATLLQGGLPDSVRKKGVFLAQEKLNLSRSFIYSEQKKVRELIGFDYHILKNLVSAATKLASVNVYGDKALLSLTKPASQLVTADYFKTAKELIDNLDTYGEAKINISYDYFDNVGDVFTVGFKPVLKGIRKITAGVRKRNGTKTTFLGVPEKKELMLAKTMEFLIEKLLGDVFDAIAWGREIEFYLNAVRYVSKLKSAGIHNTFPNFQDRKKKVVIEELYNPLLFVSSMLAGNMGSVEPVANNVKFDKNGAVMVITGPNNTGKSVYAKSVGLATVLAQNGLPIPAKSAQMTEYDNVLTHFISTGSITKGEGMFVEELRRIRELFCTAYPRSLIIIDEPVKGSSFEDAEVVALRVLEGLKILGAHTCLTTHLHNVATEVDGWEGVINMRTEIKGGRSTHRVIPGQEKSYGISIADDYGLTKEMILEMVQKKKEEDNERCVI